MVLLHLYFQAYAFWWLLTFIHSFKRKIATTFPSKGNSYNYECWTSLVAQWLGCCTVIAAGASSITSGELRPCMPQILLSVRCGRKNRKEKRFFKKWTLILFYFHISVKNLTSSLYLTIAQYAISASYLTSDIYELGPLCEDEWFQRGMDKWEENNFMKQFHPLLPLSPWCVPKIHIQLTCNIFFLLLSLLIE